ncbi:MAG: cytochrome c3 family protein [Nitrospirae bacterium]|nr:cytochrome c3 family protein [Nitrospirota bacterium]
MKEKTMKEKTLILIVIGVAIALLGAGAAMAGGVADTKHNLSPSGTGTIHATGTQQNGEICVWCHAPHFANTDFAGAPLWNKATPSASYIMYATTIAGTTPDTSPAGITKACLSCHDGVSAINSIVNAAGSGGVVTGGTNVAFGATAAGTAYVMPAGASNLGTNLADDHPVSIVYTAGKASLKATTTGFGTGTIASLLRGGKVECSSCHDPHVASGDTTGQGTTAGALFLRLSNSGSALCLSCHGK